jgi:hypothetical protein
MSDLSAFDGDAERERQICDFRVKGKAEAEVCQMLGMTVPDIHRAFRPCPPDLPAKPTPVQEPPARRCRRQGARHQRHALTS